MKIVWRTRTRQGFVIRGIVEFPTVVRQVIREFRHLFHNERQRQHFAQHVCELILAHAITMAGINRKLAETTDQPCLKRFLTEAPWDDKTLNEARIEGPKKKHVEATSGTGISRQH